VLVLVAAKGANARRARGELRIEVRDPQGAAVPTEAELVSDANQWVVLAELSTERRTPLRHK
jgi:hypothetical protein